MNSETRRNAEDFHRELTGNILPFWMDRMRDDLHDGFYGQIDGEGVLYPQANKGAVLNARILWTFSAAYRLLGDSRYLDTAERAYHYITEYFIDKEYGGAYWDLDYLGHPVNSKKQTYAQGFMLYGLSEFYRATGASEALELAKDFFRLMEQYKDAENGGYYEAFTRGWKPIEDMRLSNKDANEKKSMNTHLHILEPYTNLLRVWPDRSLVVAQRELIKIFKERIVDPETFHQHLFFDDRWKVKSSAVSYGHDVEASWLLYEAASVLGDKELIKDISSLSLSLAKAASEGLQPDGSLAYERDGEQLDTERHWWVQAEAVVGFTNAARVSGNGQWYAKALSVWNYIRDKIVDKAKGEWYWSRLPDGSPNLKEDKAGFWKCPYHNGRMCMEMMELPD